MIEMAEVENRDGRQIIQDKKNDFTKIVFTPNRDVDYKINMRDPIVWKGFPLSERFWYSFCCKCACMTDNNSKLFQIEEMLSNQCMVDTKLNLTNQCVTLSILKSGTLDIEPKIIHPFVKISILNLKTSKYLQKKKFEEPVFLLREKNLKISNNKSQNVLEYSESVLDFIPPFSTAPYDLRVKGESYAEWNEEFIINDEAVNIYDSNTIIFFELMDFNLFFNSKNKTDCINPIAWGYLKPVGYSQTYLGKFKIQLYKYKYKETEEMKTFKKTNNSLLRTPSVLYEFNWIKKEKYQTFLEIEIRTELKPKYEDLNKIMSIRKFRNSVFRLEGDDAELEVLKLKAQKEKKLKFEELDHTAHIKRRVLLKRRRNANEECILPDRLLYKFSTARLGCLTHEFSNDGKYLAAACTNLNSITTIKIFNIEDGSFKYHFKGHQQLIHCLAWSADNIILISGSSDNQLSFWQVPAEDSNNVENLEFMDNEREFKLISISHPSYVYAVSIFPEISKDLMIVASACFDGIVRIYSVNFSYNEISKKYNFLSYSLLSQIFIFEEFEKFDFLPKNQKKIETAKNLWKINEEKASLLERTVLDHRHPNCLIFDELGRLIIGDSLGSIHIWEVNIASGKPMINKLKIVTHKELEGDNINKILIEPGEKRRLIVHSRDNSIRLVDISKEKPKVIVRYFGLKCNRTNLKSAVSPDGQYILSGSEEGKPYLWSSLSGISIPANQFECEFLDLLADVSWNKNYNVIALSGFGQEYPLLVYVHEKDEITLDPSDLKMKNKDTILGDNEAIMKDPKVLNSVDDHISDFAKEFKALIKPQL